MPKSLMSAIPFKREDLVETIELDSEIPLLSSYKLDLSADFRSNPDQQRATINRAIYDLWSEPLRKSVLLFGCAELEGTIFDPEVPQGEEEPIAPGKVRSLAKVGASQRVHVCGLEKTAEFNSVVRVTLVTLEDGRRFYLLD